MPLMLLAGAQPITSPPPDQVFATAALVSTPPELVYHDITAGGHLGLFMGHNSLQEHWPRLLAEVLKHSRE